MKKYLRSMLLLAAAIVSASMFASCGEDETDDLNPGQKEPENKVEMGYYKLDFPSLTILEWPDTKSIEEIEKKYDAYKKSITDALKYEDGKKYKWSEIEADKDRLQKLFDGFGDFEFEVQNCANKLSYAGLGTSFCAYKEGSEYRNIDFGEKKIKSKLHIPENTTCQLFVTITTVNAVPSVKEYSASVKKLYTDALKDVFTDEYGVVETSDKLARTEYFNLANFSGNSDELKNRVKDACDAVKEKVPAVPADVLKDAQDSNINVLFSINIEAFDPKSGDPSRGKTLFGYKTDIL